MLKILNKLAPRQLLLLVWGMVLLVSAALVSNMLVPKVKSYNRVSNSLVMLEGVVSSGKNLSNELFDMRQKVETVQRRLHGDIADFPLERLEAHVIEKLQSISWNHNIQLLSVTPGIGDTVEEFREIVFEINISGDYFDLYSWLLQLADELGFIIIRQFDINSNKSRPNDNQLVMRISMVAYRAIS